MKKIRQYQTVVSDSAPGLDNAVNKLIGEDWHPIGEGWHPSGPQIQTQDGDHFWYSQVMVR